MTPESQVHGDVAWLLQLDIVKARSQFRIFAQAYGIIPERFSGADLEQLSFFLSYKTCIGRFSLGSYAQIAVAAR